jgi:hypothetical protein
VRVNVAVAVRVLVAVGVRVAVSVAVRVGVEVEVRVGVRVGVPVLVGVGVDVAVFVGVMVAVGVMVGVGVTVGVFVAVRVLVRVGVAEGVTGVPLMLRTKLPLAEPLPSTTMITLWPSCSDRVTRERVLDASILSLQASWLPKHVPRRTPRIVSKSDPSVEMTYKPLTGAV